MTGLADHSHGIVAGIDVGGTFTDLIVLDMKRGAVKIGKVPTTPEDQSQAVLDALSGSGYRPSEIDLIVHGTTTTTNALLERRIAKVGMITTRGFRDVIELGRRTRPNPYGLFGTFIPLIPRNLRLEVDERIEASGRIRTPLDEEGLRAAARTLIEAGCEALVIHFIHAYRNPVHEDRAEEVLREIWPNTFITTGHALLSEAREFERGVTAAVNAAVQPILQRYVERMGGELRRGGYARDFLIMNGNGGTTSSSLVAREAAKTVMSGPASGVIAAARTAGRAGYTNLITYDMGGTSTDAALIRGSRPLISNELELEYGMPIHVPMVEVHTIGAGGGSLAKVNSAGLLEVGPQSAGSMPGPICYGRGGDQPTITDANLLLGRLDPARLLSVDEEVPLATVEEVFRANLGDRLGLSAVEAAGAVLKIANLKMAGAIRMVSVAKGNNPRDFVLYAFGGAGPLHAAAIARELGVPRVMVPPRPGITNALGCIVADLQQDYVNTVNTAVRDIDPDQLNGIIKMQVAAGLDALGEESITPVKIRIEHSLDMQFVGQTHLIRVPISGLVSKMDDIQALFEEAYYSRFRVRLPEVRANVVNVNTSVIGVRQEVPLDDLIPREGRAPTLDKALRERRQVWFDGKWLETPVYDRERLPLHAQIVGPAILEQFDATTVILPGDIAEGDALGNIMITIKSVADERH
ncbi:hydantoinase/oxoprolinase family protein [Chelativorans sp. Marseille-P2723]|uniref:hydantoinase/oxoprolinase family protein n=1 Tax=Chelativorans sp. Marseille-P2723 TaxID=2709133 RepID=UPI001571351B|nr:hydantoinase/oxoprolinase family protein [Chelativorans sp. Marseille-P2723]